MSAAAIVIVSAGAILLLVRLFQLQTGYNVRVEDCPYKKGPPPTARNLCYHYPGAFGASRYFEFDVPPEEFLAWAKSKGWKVKQVQDRPYDMRTYGRYLPDTTGPSEIKIREGYFYERATRGMSMQVAYDLTTGRAYYHLSTR